MKRLATALMATLLVAGAATLRAENNADAERMLKAAQNTELVDGDLNGAIKQYAAIVSKYVKTDRAVTAMALVHMAEAYQKMGDAEAHKIYEQVVRDYADQKEAAAVARVKMGREAGIRDKRMSFRQVWNLPDQGDLLGAISRDGRYFPYIDWADHGNLFVHDFLSDTDRRLTDTANDSLPGPKVWQAADGDTAFSRDSKQLCYSWGRGDRYELRLVELKGDGIPRSRLLFDNPDIHWIQPRDWSPDGKYIAVNVHRFDRTAQIGLVSVSDGALRVLRSVDWRGSTTLAFSPDGKYLAYDVPAGENPEQRDIFVLASDGSRDIPALIGPSDDTVVGWSNDGKRLLFASDRSGSKSLWSVPFLGGEMEGPPELLRSDIGPTLSVGLTNSGQLYASGDGLFLAGDVYEATIDSATGRLLSRPSLAAQTYVGRNRWPTWSPDGKYLAYASVRGPRQLSHFVIAIRSVETGNMREITPSPGLDVVYTLAWAPDGLSFLLRARDTKGRYGLFRVDAQTGQAPILVTQGNGESLAPAGISADGKKLYYGKLNLAAHEEVWIERDLASGGERELRRTHYAATPSAPALSPDGRYLAGGGNPAVIVLPVGGGKFRELAREAGPFNHFGLAWFSDSSAVYADSSSRQFWRIPIDGSEPRKLDLKWEGTDQRIRMLRVHPDGRHLAFEVEPARHPTEVWVLENFLPTPTARK